VNVGILFVKCFDNVLYILKNGIPNFLAIFFKIEVWNIDVVFFYQIWEQIIFKIEFVKVVIVDFIKISIMNGIVQLPFPLENKTLTTPDPSFSLNKVCLPDIFTE
jgi:hypothetical protein